MTWGQANWATYPWGYGSTGGMTILSAFALSPHVVRVTLSRAPRSKSVLTPGDALNPQAWLVQLADLSMTFTVLSVRHVSSETVWELYVLQKFAPAGIDHRVRSVVIRDNQGTLIGDPNFAIFSGIEAPLENPLAVANPYDLYNSPEKGVLEIDSSGDLRRMRGKALLEKLVIRRLTTSVGGFTYMPEYGLGLRVKEPLVSSDLVKLQAEIERQLLREDEIVECQARLRLDPGGILYVIVKAKMQSGETAEVPVPVRPIMI